MKPEFVFLALLCVFMAFAVCKWSKNNISIGGHTFKVVGMLENKIDGDVVYMPVYKEIK